MPQVGKVFKWSDAEVEVLSSMYASKSTKEIGVYFGVSERVVFSKAHAMGLKKDEAYLVTLKNRLGNGQGIKTRFQKGSVPPNKGKHVPAHPNSKATQFKKGMHTHNWMPVGSERINAGGYPERKVADTGKLHEDWKPIHRLNWIKKNGPITKGMVLIFKDGDKLNTDIENLELIKNSELLERNSIHRFPPELVATIHALSIVKRKLAKQKELRKSD